MTEVAIAIARSLANDLETLLVDMDQHWPSVAQRLDLPLHPNIRTALDHALHRVDRLDEAIHRFEDLRVVGGRADGGQGTEISRADSMMLLDTLGSACDVVAADLGPLSGSFALIREFDTVIVVGEGTPVGVARLIKTCGALRSHHPDKSLLAVVNKTGRGTFQRSEVINEIGRVLSGLPVVTLPYEPRLEQASWDGALVVRGRYGRAVSDVANVVVRSLA